MSVSNGGAATYYMTGKGAVYVIIETTQVILRTGGYYKKLGQVDCTIGRIFEDTIKISSTDALRILNDE